MATNRPSLYGTYPYAGDSTAPILYATGYIAQTFSVSLAEAIAGTDSDAINMRPVLADSLTLTAAQVNKITKVLTDSVTSTEAVVKTVQKVLTDSASISDANVIFTIKQLSDFLVLKEFLSVNLKRATIWVNPGSNENTFDTLYGKYKYGTTPFGGVTPTSTWTAGPKRTENWTQSDGHKNG